MDSLIFAINAVAPIMLLVIVGYYLKKLGWIKAEFAKSANRLVFHLFLPTMLFLNVYKISDFSGIDIDYIIYTALMLIAIFALSIGPVLLVEKKQNRRGVLLQASFRSNYALIGIPLAQSLRGDEGIMIATVLSAVTVPLLNILAVISLSAFHRDGERLSIKKILLDICKNPLIEGVALGLVILAIRTVFVKYNISFRISDITPLYTALEYLSDLTTPLALLMLGAQFEFSHVKQLQKEITFGTLMRTVIVPIVGIGTAYLFFGDRFNGAHFAAFVAVYATPVSVSSVPMAQEMGGDATLAGQLVIWTTLFSALSVFIISFLLRMAGVFS